MTWNQDLKRRAGAALPSFFIYLLSISSGSDLSWFIFIDSKCQTFLLLHLFVLPQSDRFLSMFSKSSPPCHVSRTLWAMTIYRTPYYCLCYIHTRRESLFFFFFSLRFLSNKPRGMQQGERGQQQQQQQFVQQSCCLHMPVRLFTGLTDFTELMNHESVDRWVSGGVFRSHISM